MDVPGSRDGLGHGAHRALRVLTVDDDPALRLLYRVNLELSGAQVVEAPDGETALRLLEDELPDVVLLDVIMPGMDGWTLAERLARDGRTRSLPVVFTTALPEDTVAARVAELGAAGYLRKPFNPSRLADDLGAILATARRRTARRPRAAAECCRGG